MRTIPYPDDPRVYAKVLPFKKSSLEDTEFRPIRALTLLWQLLLILFR